MGRGGGKQKRKTKKLDQALAPAESPWVRLNERRAAFRERLVDPLRYPYIDGDGAIVPALKVQLQELTADIFWQIAVDTVNARKEKEDGGYTNV